MTESSHPSTYKSPSGKSRMKSEGCKREQEEVLKTEVTTPTRMVHRPASAMQKIHDSPFPDRREEMRVMMRSAPTTEIRTGEEE